MKAEVDFTVLPYDSSERGSLSDILVDELQSEEWNRLQMAVAFAKNSLERHGLLLQTLQNFVREDGKLEVTVGADVFGGEAKGTDYDAVNRLLSIIEQSENAEFYLYHEGGRTFHPKVYFFSNEPENRALLIVGSSNLSDGGLRNNIEANVRVSFDLEEESHRQEYERIKEIFSKYWTEEE
jgi:HKD family nuclease